MTKKVSAVIPTFNGLTLLKRNLPAVIKCLRDGDEVLVVDDASQDDTVQWVNEHYGDGITRDNAQVTVKVIKNTQNLRFGATVNKGVEAATGELILLLNNDVKPRSDILKYLVPHFDSANVFAVGCLEIEKNSKGQLQHGGKNRLWFQRGLFMHARAKDFSSGNTAWVSGGSGLFDRQKWLLLKGFDALFYPAYWEDIDLSFRARKLGWQVLFEEKAVVEHIHETTHQDVFGQKKIDTMSWRNGQKFAWKNGSLWQKLQYLLWYPYWVIKRGLV